MTSEEADLVDGLEARVKAMPSDTHTRCEFWEAERVRTGKTMPNAARYIAERTELECQNDHAYKFRGTAAERDAAFAKATLGHEAVGEPTVVEAGVERKLPLERGGCYIVTFRFDEGFAPKSYVSIEHKRVVSFVGGIVAYGNTDSGPGPGAIAKLSCVFTTQEGTLVLQADPGVKAEMRVFVQRMTEAETARREASEAAGWQQAGVQSQAAQAAGRQGHCERCILDMERCIGDVFRGQAPVSGPCLPAYLSCLEEDRGDGVVTAAECAQVAAAR